MDKTLFERIKEWFQIGSPQKQRASRSYGAARRTRQNADWTTRTTTTNYDAYVSLTALRARARQMCRDDAYFRKFLQLAESNVIGSQGIQVDPRAYVPGDARTLDKSANDEVKRRFWEWSSDPRNCSVTGRVDHAAQQRLFIRTFIRDGEVLILKSPSGPWGLQLKFIDPAYLDERYNTTLSNGNRVIMSVEIDDLDQPVAYWLTPPASEYMFRKERQRERKRYAAEQIIHEFLVIDDDSQVRGITHFAAALQTGKDRHHFGSAVLSQAKVTAMAGGFLIPPEDDTPGWTGEDGDGNPLAPAFEWQSLAMPELPPGYDFKAFDPKQPTQNHPAYMQTLISELATGVGVHYFTLAGDMEAVNYSSARVGLGEEREGIWRTLQEFTITHFCQPVYDEWLLAAWASRRLNITASQLEQVRRPYWQPRGYDYVDPQKEINAQLIGVTNGLLTVTDVLAKRGVDIVDHLETIQKDRKLFEEYGVPYPVADTADETPADKPDDEEQTPKQKKSASASA